MEKYIKISNEEKKRIEENYRRFYEDSRKKNKKIRYEDLERLLPSSLVKREWDALQQGKSYYLDLLIPIQDRANGRCELTGIKCNNLQLHHIDNYQHKIQERLNPTNVVALCPEAHRRFHQEYSYKRCNRQQWEIFKRDFNNGKITIYPNHR